MSTFRDQFYAPGTGFGIVLLSLVVASAGQRSTLGAPYSGIVTFGDSFSDSGNVYQATLGLIPPDPPYYQGRFSDGPVWVEHLGRALGRDVTANGLDPTVVRGNNFAVGGARVAVDVPVFDGAAVIPSIVHQVEYVVDALGAVPPDTLYVVFGGHNDVRFAADPAEGLDAAGQEDVVNAAVDGVTQAITRLEQAGARTFLVPNLADLGVTPEAVVVRKNAPAVSALTVRFNERLALALDVVEATLGVEIFRVDVFAAANEVVDDARNHAGEMFGITNIDVPIFPGFAGSPGAPAETALFADDLHVSAVAHALLGELAAAALGVDTTAGWQVPGDCNQDGILDISDAVCVFGFLFLGTPRELPCGDPGDPEPDGPAGFADRALVDWTGDGAVDISDGVALLTSLFGGGPDHVLAADGSCVRITGCPSICGP